MERRDFLKLLGLTGLSLAGGCNPFIPPAPLPSPSYEPTLAERTATSSTQTRTPSSNAESGLKRERENQGVENPLKALMASPIFEADRARLERAKSDPEWKERVNPKLLRFYCFTFFGYGETNEPGPKGITPPGVIIGTYSIFAYDSLTGKPYKLSISHDFNSPEIAQRKYNNPEIVNLATRISEAYASGGFPLMRQVLENVFGLSMDFQVAISDKLIASLVDEVRHGIDVEIPYEDGVTLYPYYIDGKLQPDSNGWSLNKGMHKIGGNTAVGLIKAVPIPRFPGDYEKAKEHHVREDLVVAGLKKDFFKSLILDPLMSARLFNFLTSIPSRKNLLDYDFDWQKVVLGNIQETFYKLTQLFRNKSADLTIPDFAKSVYFADDNSGIGGGLRYNNDTFVPPGFSFAGDVRKNYWQAFRNFTEKLLLE